MSASEHFDKMEAATAAIRNERPAGMSEGASPESPGPAKVVAAVPTGCPAPANPLPSPTMESYDAYLEAWKAKNGITQQDGNADELKMLAEDAKDTSDDYCMECGQKFRVCDMSLILRSIDPYLQMEDESPREDDYIKSDNRVRMCKPCFKQNYEDEEPGQDNNPDVAGRR